MISIQGLSWLALPTIPGAIIPPCHNPRAALLRQAPGTEVEGRGGSQAAGGGRRELPRARWGRGGGSGPCSLVDEPETCSTMPKS